MLSYILGLIYQFQRKHGRLPRMVCLNHGHLAELKSECPGIFNKKQWPLLGFRIAIFSEYELPHPKVVWLPSIRNFNNLKRALREKEGRKIYSSSKANLEK